MLTIKKLAAGAAMTVLATAAMTATAYAQETTGGINGSITDDAGRPLGGVGVRVIYTPTNQTFTTTTDASGQFAVRQLPPGGPYSVVAGDASHAGKTVTVPLVSLGSAYELNFSLNSATAVSEVVVSAARTRGTGQVQTGPRSTFTAADIQTLPSFQRDIKDIVRLNPFVTIDPTNNNALIIAGNNNRANVLYIDGTRQADDFGLNGNGYPGQRSPISVDLIESLNVEVAPFDVQYGSFTGGVVNITTKSGSNDFHGSGFYEYDSDGLGGGQEFTRPFFSNNNVGFNKTATSQPYASANIKFKDKNYGGTVGGPIVKDKLFFEFGYEKYESGSNFSFGPQDAATSNQVPGVTNAQVTDIQAILSAPKGQAVTTPGGIRGTGYGYNPLGYSASFLPIEDEKIFGKLTWQVTDRQRLVFVAQTEHGTQVNSNDDSVTGRNLSLLSDWYNYNQNLDVYTGTLYSNWTSAFATEITYSHKNSSNITQNLAGDTFANFNIVTTSAGAAQTTRLFLGPNVSRQANVLTNTDQLFRIRGNYALGRHRITAGYEREWLDVFNLFVQNANGSYSFNSIQDLANHNASSLTYANAASNVKTDGAAQFGDVINTFYIQDEWKPFSNLTVKIGVRDELYEQKAKPLNNPYILSQYGFNNRSTLDGDNVVMPRVGFNWRPDPTLVFNGGFGLFSGGSPNVWISNNYTNTGDLLGSVNFRCPVAGVTTGAGSCDASLIGVDGFNVGQTAKTANSASANAGTGISNELSPNFEPPSTWKASLGFTKRFDFSEYKFLGFAGRLIGDDWRIHGDYLYQFVNKAVFWQDLLSLNNQLGVAPDGRPTFNVARFTANPATGRLARPNEYDLLLTNTDRGFANSFNVGLGKAWANGVSFGVNYTHTSAFEVNPGTSSVALSNYAQNAFSNPNNPSLSISNYSIKNQVKINLGYEHKVFGDYRTSLRIFAQRRSGLPFSYTYNQNISSGTGNDQLYGIAGAVAFRNNELLYVPKTAGGSVTLASDPIITYAPGFDIAGFNAFLKSTGLIKYAGQISPRNAFTSRDITQIDLNFSQEIPAFFPHGAKGELYFDIFNLGNLLNSSWGVVEQYGFPYFASDVVAVNCQVNAPSAPAAGTCAAGRGNFYEYRTYNQNAPGVSISNNGVPTSLWALKVGVRYKF